MDSKPLVASKSFWGALISLQPAVLAILQIMGKGSLLPIVDPLFALLSAIGGGLGMIGVITRKTKINSIF